MPHEFPHPVLHGRRVLWEGSVGSFGIDDLEVAPGRRFELAVLRHPGAAAVIPFAAPGEILMLRQYRHAAGGTLWELPAGKLDAGETPAVCAARELEEETGFSAGRLVPLGKIHTSPGFCDEVIHLFAAHDLSPGRRDLQPDESIVVERLPLARVLEMVAAGEITDGKTLCALFLAERVAGGQR